MDIPEDPELILDICDQAVADEQSAKEAVAALQRKFLYAILFHREVPFLNIH